MDPEEQAAKYAWQARRFLWLTNHIMRLGQTGSFVDDMQVEREQLRRTVPAQYIEDAIKEGVGVNEKGIFHLETRVFYNGDESVSAYLAPFRTQGLRAGGRRSGPELIIMNNSQYS